MTTIKPFQCRVCEAWKGESHIADEFTFAEDEPPLYLCDTCDEERSRKFDSGLAQVAYALSMDGLAEDVMGGQYNGEYLERLGNIILIQNERGFVTAYDEGSAEAVQREWDRLYSAGYGATEDDAYIDAGPGGYHLTISGEAVGGAFATHIDALIAAESEMQRSDWYPSAWWVDDCGHLSEIDLGAEFRSHLLQEYGVDTDVQAIDTLHEMILKEREKREEAEEEDC